MFNLSFAVLLEWCRQTIGHYEHIHLTNWTTSWWDGLPYCALIHRFYPNVIDYQSISPENKVENLKLAFDTLEVIFILFFFVIIIVYLIRFFL